MAGGAASPAACLPDLALLGALNCRVPPDSSPAQRCPLPEWQVVAEDRPASTQCRPGRAPDRSGRGPGQLASASAQGGIPAAHPDDTVSPGAGPRIVGPRLQWRPPCRPLRDRVRHGSLATRRATTQDVTEGSQGHAETQETPATAYFPEGLPPEYLRRWRA
jgi:hypothetical protein